MSGARKPPVETRTETQRLLADLAHYSTSSAPGRARRLIENLQSEVEMRGIPAGVDAVSLTAAAGLLARGARAYQGEEREALLRVVRWLEGLARR